MIQLFIMPIKLFSLNTYHPSANYFAGLIYMAEGDLTDALESLGWAARSMEYRSNAYSLWLKIGLRKNEIQLAEHYASLSLDFNSTNLNALQLLAILYRKSGENDKLTRIWSPSERSIPWVIFQILRAICRILLQITGHALAQP